MISTLFRRDFLRRLGHRFIAAPAGFGRPLPREVLDREYASGAWAHFHGLSEMSRQVLMAGLAAHLHPHPRVLDVGCGSGQLASLFHLFDCQRYVGVDLSTEGIRRARGLALSGCEFIEADFESWRPEERFNVILFSECIGYARDPGALTASFIPFLMPGGHVLISNFRSGHWAANWRRVEQHFGIIESTIVTNRAGQTWDVRVLQPLGRS